MTTATYQQWAEHLRRVTAPSLAGSPIWDAADRARGEASSSATIDFVESFEDEHGHRRAVDGAFLAHLAGLREARGGESGELDVRLFQALWEPASEPGELLEPRGALQPEPREGLEIWTERELASLHALWWIAHQRGRDDLHARAMEAAGWHVDNIQPDNATNHPWAVHVFLELGVSGGETTSLMHAESLVHNSRVISGRPDRFSACVLFDASRALDILGG